MRNPSELPRQVLAWADRHGMLPFGSTVLCALSGGADSMALLTCLLDLAAERNLTVLAAHYNHQLRGEESHRDEVFTADWCRKKDVPLTVGRGDVAAAAAKGGRGIEETARSLRYAFLEQTARDLGADFIATAHNADDNAETLLLHLVRGTGLDGLTGIPPKRENLIRPLLAVTRQEIEDYLSCRGVPHVEDSSNADPAYARNRLRREVLPVLRDLNPSFASRLTANLAHIRADRAFLEGLAEEVSQTARPEETGFSLDAGELASLPRPVAVRVVKQVLARLDRHQVSAVHLEQVLTLAESTDPSAWVSLPQGLLVRRVYDRLLFSYSVKKESFLPIFLPGEGVYEAGPWRLDLQTIPCPEQPEQGPWRWYLGPVTFPLEVRPRRTGDTLSLPGRPRKTLKKWYIDEKIPRQDRDALPVLADKHGLLAAGGLGPEESRTASPGQTALLVTLGKNR